MATKRTPGSRPGLIRCENCGEEYSSSYRRCPFCDEYEEYGDYDSSRSSSQRTATTSPRGGGGKRLAPSNRRGGGYTKVSPLKVISFVISLAIILAAIWIVATKVVPLVRRGDVTTPDSQTSQNLDPDTSPNVSDDADPNTSTSPVVSPDISTSPDVSTSPDPSTTDGGATGLSLNKTEFAFSDRYPDPVTISVTFSPAGSEGTITWSSSNPDIVSVDANGKVSPGTKRGTATITAALPNGATQTCKVYNQITSAAASSSSGSSGTSSETSSATYTVNNPDFTFYRTGETYQLKVTGYSGGVTWSSSNTSIATVSSDGTVTATGTGKGSCTVTGTLDNGSTVKAIVRINIS